MNGVPLRLSFATVALAAVASAAAAAEPATAPPVIAAPRVAVLHGTYDHQRHHQEHDAILRQLGWPASKYALTDVDRLVTALDQFDLVLGNPLFNYGPDTRDFGVHAAAWRRFLERGGAILLTDCNYPGCVNWLESIDPSCRAATAPCGADRPARESDPCHPLHCLPNPVVGGSSWQHLRLAEDGPWEVVTRCGDGQATTAVRALGAGLLLITSGWPLRATELENAWTNLRLRRLGLSATRFARAPLGIGDGDVTLGLRGGRDAVDKVTLQLSVETTAGQVRRFTATAELTGDIEAVLRLPYRINRADDRGCVRLSLDAAGRTVTLLDQALALPPLLAATVRQPAYRGIAMAADWPGEVVLRTTVTPDAERLEELALAARVSTTAGSDVARLERRAVSERETTLRLPLARPEPGDYIVHTELWRGEAVVAAVESPLMLLPERPATVVIDGKLNLVVDGKPFFTLGMYHVGEADLPAVAALGINTVQGWGGNLERARRFLDAARQNGLKVLLEMGGMVDQTVNRQAIEAHVQAFKDHPALLAWYVRDEPSPAQQPVVREAAELFRRLDPAHPTYMVSCRPSEFAAEAHLADIFAVDPYPLPGGAITTVAKWTDAAREATLDERPVWLIPQAHDNTSYDRKPPERGARPPTPEQERCMLYQCLIHGAKGIVWYTWDDGPNMGVKYHPAMQAVIRELCAEATALAPLLRDGSQRPLSAAEGKVHGLVAAAPAGHCLLVVNTAAERVTAEFEVDEAVPGQAFTPVGNGAATACQGKRLRLDLAPLAAQAYRF